VPRQAASTRNSDTGQAASPNKKRLFLVWGREKTRSFRGEESLPKVPGLQGINPIWGSERVKEKHEKHEETGPRTRCTRSF